MPRFSCLVTCAVVLLVLPVSATAEPMPRIRAMDRLAQGALESGNRRSATFRALVAEVDHSDLIVHVLTTRALPDSLVAETRFAARSGVTRYVRIHIDTTLSPMMRIAMLAHELQHACELARSDATTASEYRALYEDIGFVTGPDRRFETLEAEATGRRVWLEIAGRAADTTEQ